MRLPAATNVVIGAGAERTACPSSHARPTIERVSDGSAPPLVQAHILHSAGADPAVDRVVGDDPRTRLIVVFVPEPAAAPDVARSLVDDEGVQLIELDGGLGAVWAARVIEAVDGRVPVGAVMFGAESLDGAAAYGARYQAEASEET